MSHVFIFLSAVTGEFREYREQLGRMLRQKNATVRIQEDFTSTGESTLSKLSSYVAPCAAVIHFAGHQSGHPASNVEELKRKHPDLATRVPGLAPFLQPGAPALSYTQWEAYLALYHGLKLFIAKPTSVKLEDMEPAQREHITRLQTIDRWPEISFANVDQLISGILTSAVLELLSHANASLSEVAVNRLLDQLDRQDAVDLIVEEDAGEFRVVCSTERDGISDLRQRLKDIELPWLSRRETPECARMSRRDWRRHLLSTGTAKAWDAHFVHWPFTDDQFVELTLEEAHDEFIRRLTNEFPIRQQGDRLASLYRHLQLVRESHIIYVELNDASERARDSAALIARLCATFKDAPHDRLRVVICIQARFPAPLARRAALVSEALASFPDVRRVTLREVQREQLLEWAELAEKVVLMTANMVMREVHAVYEQAGLIKLPFGITLGVRRLRTLPMDHLRNALEVRIKRWAVGHPSQ